MAIKAATGGIIIGNAPKPSVGVVVQKSGKVLGVDSKTLSLGSPSVVGYEEGIITVGIGEIEEALKNGVNTVYVLLKSGDSELISEEHPLNPGMILEIPFEVPFDVKWEVFACVLIGEVEIRGTPIGLYVPSVSIPKPLSPSNPLPPAKPVKETQDIINNLWPEKPLCAWQKEEEGSFIPMGSEVLDSQRMRVLINYPTNTTTSVDLLKFYVPQVQVQISLSPTFDTVLYTEMDADVTIPSYSKVTEVPIQLTALWDAGAIVAEEYYARARVIGGIRTRPPITSEWSEITSVNVTEEQGPTLSYSSLLFQEAVANDGSIAGSVTVSILDGVYSAGVANFVEVTGIPDGLMAQIVRDSDTQVSISFLGNAYNHAAVNSSPFTVSFIQGAFESLTPAEVVGAEQLMQMNFVNPTLNPSLAYSTTTLSEAVANNGSISGSVVVTLTDGTFALDVTSYISVTGIPEGLTPQLTRNSDTQVSFSLSGVATSHTTANNAQVSFSFLEGAFNSLLPSEVANFEESISVVFSNPAVEISLQASTDTLLEGLDGILPPVYFTLSSGSWAASGILTNTTITGLPAGLTASVNRVSVTQIRITFNGNTSHLGTHPISIQFLSAAFGANTYSNLTSTQFTVSLQFRDSPPVYISASPFIFRERELNDGVMPDSVYIPLTGDTFTAGVASFVSVTNVPQGLTPAITRYSDSAIGLRLNGSALSHGVAQNVTLSVEFLAGAFTNTDPAMVGNNPQTSYQVSFRDPEPLALVYSSTDFFERAESDGIISNSLTITCVGDTFTAGVLGLISTQNVPSGLLAEFTLQNSTQILMTLTGSATNHASINTLTNMGVAFAEGAFTSHLASEILRASRSDLRIFFSGAAPVIPASLAYSTMEFTESEGNDGTISNTMVITLTGDTFRTDVVSGGKVAVTGGFLPAGLSASFTRDSSTQLTLRINGTAIAHTPAANVSGYGIKFYSEAFTTKYTTQVTNNEVTGLSFTFRDSPPSLAYSSSVIVEDVDSEGVFSTTTTATLAFAVWAESVSGTFEALPSGINGALTRLSDTQVQISFTGTTIDSVSLATLTFADASFEGVLASQVQNSSTDLEFRARPRISWASTEFIETTGGQVGNLECTLMGDTFVSNPTIYATLGGYPTGFTPQFTKLSSTTLGVSLSGFALQHEASDSVSGVSFGLEKYALTSQLVPHGLQSTLSVTFTSEQASPQVQLSPSTLLERIEHDGVLESYETYLNITSGTWGTDLTKLTLRHPQTELTWEATRVSDTSIKILLAGTITTDKFFTFDYSTDIAVPALESSGTVYLRVNTRNASEYWLVGGEEVYEGDSVVLGTPAIQRSGSTVFSLGSVRAPYSEDFSPTEHLNTLWTITTGDLTTGVITTGEGLLSFTLNNSLIPVESSSLRVFFNLVGSEGSSGYVGSEELTVLSYVVGDIEVLGNSILTSTLDGRIENTLTLVDLMTFPVGDTLQEATWEFRDAEGDVICTLTSTGTSVVLPKDSLYGSEVTIRVTLQSQTITSGYQEFTASCFGLQEWSIQESVSVQYVESLENLSVTLTVPVGESHVNSSWALSTSANAQDVGSRILSIPYSSEHLLSAPVPESTLTSTDPEVLTMRIFLHVQCEGTETYSGWRTFLLSFDTFRAYIDRYLPTTDFVLDSPVEFPCSPNTFVKVSESSNPLAESLVEISLVNEDFYTEYAFPRGSYWVHAQMTELGLTSPWTSSHFVMGERWTWSIEVPVSLDLEGSNFFVPQVTFSPAFETVAYYNWELREKATGLLVHHEVTTGVLDLLGTYFQPSTEYTLKGTLGGSLGTTSEVYEDFYSSPLSPWVFSASVSNGYLTPSTECTFTLGVTTYDSLGSIAKTSWVLDYTEDKTGVPLLESLDNTVNTTTINFTPPSTLEEDFVFLHVRVQGAEWSEWKTFKFATTTQLSAYWGVQLIASLEDSSHVQGYLSVVKPVEAESLVQVRWVLSRSEDMTDALSMIHAELGPTSKLLTLSTPLGVGTYYLGAKAEGVFSESLWTIQMLTVASPAIYTITSITPVDGLV